MQLTEKQMIISCFILIKYFYNFSSFMNFKTIAVFQDYIYKSYFVLYIHDLFRS